jgi:hypothetical protein
LRVLKSYKSVKNPGEARLTGVFDLSVKNYPIFVNFRTELVVYGQSEIKSSAEIAPKAFPATDTSYQVAGTACTSDGTTDKKGAGRESCFGD